MKYFILVLILLISCCDTSSPEDVAEAQILEILDTIIASFTFNDLNEIMQNYHPDFLHNGDDYDFEVIRWEIRLNDYDEIDFTDIDIELDGDFAKVYFTMTLYDNEGNSFVTQEPSEENGDISYFYREFDDWKICG
ncbi:MAG: nuclear transport factor 2 family protein, partial [Candidatus Cloacimonetes bacterium]|nr:nuclear transport factor 2 family protein [Candidatus Cloacimonadota bacterium]